MRRPRPAARIPPQVPLRPRGAPKPHKEDRHPAATGWRPNQERETVNNSRYRRAALYDLAGLALALALLTLIGTCTLAVVR